MAANRAGLRSALSFHGSGERYVVDGQAAALLRCALENAAALNLDDRQVAALARMHWGDIPTGQLVPAVAALLTETQFHEMVSRFTEAPTEVTARAAPSQEAIEVMVVAALEKTSKDRALVETELATRVAEKLVGWGKLFGVLLALPVAALLLILSLFGISKFEDLRSAVANADALVTQAKTRLTEGGKQLEDVTTQLAQLQTQLEKSSTAAEAKIRELNGAVNEVQTTTSSLASLAFGASGANIKDVQTRVKDVQTRLKELGFFQGEPDGVYGPTTLSAVRDFQVKNGITPDGVVGPQTSSLLFKDK